MHIMMRGIDYSTKVVIDNIIGKKTFKLSPEEY